MFPEKILKIFFSWIHGPNKKNLKNHFHTTHDNYYIYKIQLIFNMPDKKTCTTCKIEKEISCFGIDRKRKDGRNGVCKACRKKIIRMPEDKQKRKLRESKPEFQKGKMEYNHEYRNRPEVKKRNNERAKKFFMSDAGKQYLLEYTNRPDVKERQKEYMKKYNQLPDIKEYRKKYAKEYIQRPEVIEKRNTPEYKARRKEYHEEYNRQPHIKQRNKETAREYRKKPGNYYKTPEYRAAHVKACHKRRTKIKELEYTLTLEEWEKIIDQQGNKCALCGKRFTKKNPATRDHIIPVARAGEYTRENIQAVHKECNSGKKDKIDKSNIVSWVTRPDLCVQEMPY